jgi:hypothetical protein
MQKHERITIVILSYLIGFTTAFIAFSFQTVPSEPDFYQSDQSYAVVDNSASVSQTSTDNKDNALKTVSVDEKMDGLYAIIDGKERIMSAQAISATSAIPGFHHQLFEVEISPNTEYIHYCAQSLDTDDFCSHFIYSVVNDVTYVVSNPDGQRLTSSIQDVDVIWSEDNTLIAGLWESASTETPWKLIARTQ